jgi:outer membrane protein assembly factor BamB
MKKFFFLSLVCAAILFAGQPEFKFIHISDTHVGSPTGADDLRRTVADINSLDGIDFIIITGDITEFGADDQLRLAKQILDSLKTPWHIIPGNHDMKWGGSGGASFKKIFGSVRFLFSFGGYTFIGLHEGPRLKMGDGHWAPEDMRWLTSVLDSIGKETPFFIATHYPIDNGIDNWYEVLNRVREYNIQAFLYGHGHRNLKQQFNGIPGVMGRSNLRAQDSVGGYNIVTVKSDSMFYQQRIPLIGNGAVWDTVPLHPVGEKIKRAYVQSPSYMVNDSFPGVNIRWQRSTGYTIASSPALWKNLLIVGDASGIVRAYIQSSGKEVWSFRSNDAVFSTPAVEQGRVVFGSTDSTIYCLNASNGRLLWKYRTGASIVASPSIHNGIAFIGGSDNKFRAVEMRSGKLKWEFTGLDGTVEAAPTIAGGKIFIGAWDKHLYCLDEKSGTLLWKWKSDRNGTLLSPAACQPAVADGKVFIAAPDRFMTAIDIVTGKEVWRTNQFHVRETIGRSADGKRIYVRTMNDSLYAISSSRNIPDAVWGLNAEFGYDINSAAMVEEKGTLYYGTKNGLLLAVNGKTGKLLWKYKCGVGIVNTIVPVAANKIIVTDSDGNIMLVESKIKRARR